MKLIVDNIVKNFDKKEYIKAIDKNNKNFKSISNYNSSHIKKQI